MYNLKYNFQQYNDMVSAYIEVLINNSMNNFQQQVRNGQLKNNEHDSNALAGSIQSLEEYLYYNYEKFPENFHTIVSSIINNVKTISVLPDNNRGIYGETQTKNKIIYINPDLADSKHLTGEERIRLYMAHELGHVVNNEWMDNVIKYTNEQISLGRLSKEHAQLIYDGFSMLNESTTQNRAEEFVYEFSGRNRPELENYSNRRLFDGETYRTNFDYYGELQEPSIMFARTLRGIGKENNDVRALDILSHRALSPNFFNSILSEYTKDQQIPAFIKEIQYMGLLKRSSYANFGYEDVSYLQNSKEYLEKLKNITAQMRDYREPIDDGFER